MGEFGVTQKRKKPWCECKSERYLLVVICKAIPLGKETISERHRQRNKGLITPLGGIIDFRLFLTFEPFPTSETKKGLKGEEMRRTYQT